MTKLNQADQSQLMDIAITNEFKQAKPSLFEQIFKNKPKKEKLIDVIKRLENEYQTIDLVTSDGKSLLFVATTSQDIQAIQYLIDQKADLNIQDKQGFTALTIATYRYHPKIVKLLLEHGADPNIKDAWGNISLMRGLDSSQHGYEIVDLLLQYKSDIYSENNYGVSIDSFLNGHIREKEIREIIQKYST